MIEGEVVTQPRGCALTLAVYAVPTILMLLGLSAIDAGLREGWMNDAVTGGLIAIGSVVLMPPVLERLRSKHWLRPFWASAAYVIGLLIVSFVLGQSFIPSASIKAKLRLKALETATQLARSRKFEQARFAVRRFETEPDPDGRVHAIIAQADAAGTVRKEAKNKSSAITEPPTVTAKSPSVPAQEVPQGPAADYAERVQTYWLPEASRLPTTVPNGGDGYGALLSKLEELASYASDGDALPLTKDQKAIHQRFKRLLAAKQAALYPRFRRSYASVLNEGLFRDDVSVVALGPSATTLRFTGSTFSRNANIDDMQQSMTSALAKLRYHRVEYRWSRYFGDGYHYDLQARPDVEIGSP